MNKNKLIHDFLEVVSRGDVGLICDQITKVHSILGNLDFQHPKTGDTPLITAAEENLTEVTCAVWGPMDSLLNSEFQDKMCRNSTITYFHERTYEATKWGVGAEAGE